MLGVALSGALWAGEAAGIAVGAQAPAFQGKTWFTADGKAPAVTGKVYLVDFWFGR